MSSLFRYVPHPHIEKRKAAGPPKVAAAVAQVHGPGPLGRFNANVGLKVTLIVGQNVQAAAADARAQATYDDADAVLHTALEIQKHLEAQDTELTRLVAAVCTPSTG
jgi:hypothetical protein